MSQTAYLLSRKNLRTFAPDVMQMPKLPSSTAEQHLICCSGYVIISLSEFWYCQRSVNIWGAVVSLWMWDCNFLAGFDYSSTVVVLIVTTSNKTCTFLSLSLSDVSQLSVRCDALTPAHACLFGVTEARQSSNIKVSEHQSVLLCTSQRSPGNIVSYLSIIYLVFPPWFPFWGMSPNKP